MTMRHYIGYGALRAVMGFFSLLPVRAASHLGGAVMRGIGPMTRFHAIAKRNLELCLPDANHAAILRGMWDNLGRTLGEHPHLATIARYHACITDPQDVLLRVKDTAQIFASAHVANWEAIPAVPLYQLNLPVDAVYRAPNNPLIDAWLKDKRSHNGRARLFGKTRRAAIEIIRALQANAKIGFLIDQKDNTGKPLQFFGHTANSNISFAELAVKMHLPVAIVLSRRIQGIDFEMTVEPIATDGLTAIEIAQVCTTKLEEFIRKYPDQFLWIHRRFDKALYQDANSASN